MTMKWWGVSISCPTHNKQLPLTGARFSADGEIAFDAFCEECNEVFRWIVSGQKIQHLAMMNDMEDWMKSQRRGIVTPPLAKAKKQHANGFTESDLRFEKDCGINPEGGI